MMSKKIALCLIVNILCFFNLFAVDKSPELQRETPPSWVQFVKIPIEPILPKKDQVNFQILLFDLQKNWKEKTVFKNIAVKALNRIGIDAISQIQITFDPIYETVHFHTIRIYRNGEWQDRMGTALYRVIQREEGLQNRIIDGKLTQVICLEDVRVGDVLEYSYSVKGESSLFSSHLSWQAHFQAQTTVEKRSLRLISYPEHFFNIKLFNGAIDPIIVDSAPDQREWKWEINASTPIVFDSNTPSWYIPYPFIQISEYKSWNEVVSVVLPLFQVLNDHDAGASSSMKAITNGWMEEFSSPCERALAALRFVQDEVRYVHLGEGLGSHKPRDPAATFESRFGDCKDKTTLLSALLKLMDIKSTPVLVNSEIGRELEHYLPSPYDFNHAILQIEIDGSFYFVDPTIGLQGGSLKTLYFPNYYFGLLISEGSSELIPLPLYVGTDPIKYQTKIKIASEDTAEMTVISTFSGDEADYMRRSLEKKGLEEFSKDTLSLMQNVYKDAEYSSPLSIADDRERNAFEMTGEFNFPLKNSKKGTSLVISPIAININLEKKIKKDRKMPFDLTYPLWIQEEILIENPHESWAIETESLTIMKDFFSCQYGLEVTKANARLYVELKHLDDHVPIDSLQEYYKAVNAILCHESTKLLAGSS